MFQQQKDWETRENAFAAFTMGPLTDFWRQRDEAEFTGVDDIPVRFVRFRAQHHDRLARETAIGCGLAECLENTLFQRTMPPGSAAQPG